MQSGRSANAGLFISAVGLACGMLLFSDLLSSAAPCILAFGIGLLVAWLWHHRRVHNLSVAAAAAIHQLFQRPTICDTKLNCLCFRACTRRADALQLRLWHILWLTGWLATAASSRLLGSLFPAGVQFSHDSVASQRATSFCLPLHRRDGATEATGRPNSAAAPQQLLINSPPSSTQHHDAAADVSAHSVSTIGGSSHHNNNNTGLTFKDWATMNSYSNLQDLPSLQQAANSSSNNNNSKQLEPLIEAVSDHPQLLALPVAQAPSTGAVGDDAGHLGSPFQQLEPLPHSQIDAPQHQQQQHQHAAVSQEGSLWLDRLQSHACASSSTTTPPSSDHPNTRSNPHPPPPHSRLGRSLTASDGSRLPVNDSVSSRPDHLGSHLSAISAPPHQDDSSLWGGDGKPLRRQLSGHSPPLTCTALEYRSMWRMQS